MLIRELYQEGPTSTLTHDGNEYSVDKLLQLTANVKVTNIAVDKLSWCIPNNLDADRVESADIQIPIIVTSYGDKLVVLDGAHRVKQALNSNVSTIPSKYILPTILATARI